MEKEGNASRLSKFMSKKSFRIGLGIILSLGAVAVVFALTGGKVTSADNQIQAGYTGVKVPEFAKCRQRRSR
jgi:hypothetical protein